jgi:hypothetical protein
VVQSGADSADAPDAASPHPGRRLARLPTPRPGQVVTAAGHTVVTAARLGRLLGRAGWRAAQQVPGVAAAEERAQRLAVAAARDLGRRVAPSPAGPPSSDEARVMMLIPGAGTDPAPLRTAMGELLDRAGAADHLAGQDYLFGTILSQLVPDEARILAALAEDRAYAAVDVVARSGRRGSEPVLENASTVGPAAGVAVPRNTPTYLGRLQALGLIEFGPPGDDLERQFDTLDEDATVRDAWRAANTGRGRRARIIRKQVTMSGLGRQFWAASAPEIGS